MTPAPTISMNGLIINTNVSAAFQSCQQCLHVYQNILVYLHPDVTALIKTQSKSQPHTPVHTLTHTHLERSRGPAARLRGLLLCLRYCIQPQTSSCAIITYSRKMSTAGSIQPHAPLDENRLVQMETVQLRANSTGLQTELAGGLLQDEG